MLSAYHQSEKKEPKVDGWSVFLYLDKNDMPMVALHWEKYFEHIITKCNSIYKEELPKVTPHVSRHTYCSNMAKSGMNPKTLQYLMERDYGSDAEISYSSAKWCGIFCE